MTAISHSPYAACISRAIREGHVLECRVSEEYNYETLTREVMRGSDEVYLLRHISFFTNIYRSINNENTTAIGAHNDKAHKARYTRGSLLLKHATQVSTHEGHDEGAEG